MGIIKFIVFTSLIINYTSLLINFIKGRYKNNIRNLCIDVWVSYFLAPILTIALIWECVDKLKTK